MSSSVSQLEFWREANPKSSTKNDEEGGPGAEYLSYDIFMGLSVLGGFFALDHLYLRSPLTFLAKLIVNFMFFGVWWLYDASQAVFNSDAVKIFGLGVPGLGPKGIAAGVLANPVPDQKHLRFFTYAAALCFGGMLGIDSFILGDNTSGFIRLISCITLIFMPVALCWWAYNLFRFFTNTKAVIGENSDFFGAPNGSFQDSFLANFPFLGFLFHPIDSLKSFLRDVLGDAIKPLTETADLAIGTVNKAISTVEDTVQLGRNTISKGSEIVGQISNTVDKVSKASQVMPGVSLYSSITPEMVKKELDKDSKAAGMVGGAAIIAAMDLNPIHYILLVTIVTIVLGGAFVTYYRSKNVPDQRDDSPPEPGVFRELDQANS